MSHGVPRRESNPRQIWRHSQGRAIAPRAQTRILHAVSYN